MTPSPKAVLGKSTYMITYGHFCETNPIKLTDRKFSQDHAPGKAPIDDLSRKYSKVLARPLELLRAKRATLEPVAYHVRREERLGCKRRSCERFGLALRLVTKFGCV